MGESRISVTKSIITETIERYVLYFQSHVRCNLFQVSARPFHSTAVPDGRQDIATGKVTRYRSDAPGFDRR